VKTGVAQSRASVRKTFVVATSEMAIDTWPTEVTPTRDVGLGIDNLVDLIDILHDDTVPTAPRPYWRGAPSTAAPPAWRPCRLRARELFQSTAHLSGATRVDRADVLRLLDHAATALEDPDKWRKSELGGGTAGSRLYTIQTLTVSARDRKRARATRPPWR
jgi:hypothetical protein